MRALLALAAVAVSSAVPAPAGSDAAAGAPLAGAAARFKATIKPLFVYQGLVVGSEAEP